MSRWRLVLPLLACWFASAGAALAWHRQARGLDAEAAVVGARAEALQQGVRQLTAELAAAQRLTVPAAVRPDRVAAIALHPAAQAARVLALLRGAEATHGVRWRTLTLGRPGVAPALANPPPAPAPVGFGTTASATAGSTATATIGPTWQAAPTGGVSLATRPFDTLFVASTALPEMRMATLSATGEYRSLAQLQALLDALVDAGAALTELTLDDDRLQLTALLINLYR
jgi:hypothetical protein